VVSCYEAGREGFFLHRYLESRGIRNVVVDASSIEVSRRRRRAKTDRLDVKKLLDKLIGFHRKEKRVWSVVRVPSVEEEDGRRLHRELESLKKERTRHRNRIRSLLFGQGIRLRRWKDVKAVLEGRRLWDGRPLPRGLKGELERELARYELVEEQVKLLHGEQERQIKEPSSANSRKAARLVRLRAVGPRSSWVVSHEFGWRRFKNRRQVGACAGLVPTPHESGSQGKELGISKEGVSRVRTMMIELSWQWIRLQPQSKISKWFQERFGGGGKRVRRIGIVAVARRLLIALWKMMEYGEIPEGAELKSL
jgi:transposase